MAHSRNFIDRTGQKVHRLTFIEFVERAENGAARWRVKCDCGTVFIATGSNIIYGMTKSCGCYRAEKNKIEGLKRRKRKGNGYKTNNSTDSPCVEG